MEATNSLVLSVTPCLRGSYALGSCEGQTGRIVLTTETQRHGKDRAFSRSRPAETGPNGRRDTAATIIFSVPLCLCGGFCFRSPQRRRRKARIRSHPPAQSPARRLRGSS